MWIVKGAHTSSAPWMHQCIGCQFKTRHSVTMRFFKLRFLSYSSFSEIDELRIVNRNFLIHPIFYMIHTMSYMVGKRRLQAFKWYIVCENWLRIEATGAI